MNTTTTKMLKMTKKIKKKREKHIRTTMMMMMMKKKTKYINNDKQKPPQPPIILLFCGSFICISCHKSHTWWNNVHFFATLPCGACGGFKVFWDICLNSNKISYFKINDVFSNNSKYQKLMQGRGKNFQSRTLINMSIFSFFFTS